MEQFKTIKEQVTAEIEEKKSKFIAKCFPITSEKEAKDIILKIKKSYGDAKHHCFAYKVIEEDQVIERTSDDGEPSGTAGIPILGTIQSNHLCNILMIVIRYFGGTLLGTGGLVRAYSTSSKEAISLADFIEKQKGYEVSLEIEYSKLENLQYFLNKNNIRIIHTNYFEDVQVIVEISAKIKEELTNKQKNDLKSLKIDFLKQKFIDI